MANRNNEKVPSYSLIKGSLAELIAVLGEPRCIPSDDDRTRIEWDYLTKIDGNVVTIYGYQEYLSTPVYMQWHVDGVYTLNGSSATREITELLNTEFFNSEEFKNLEK